MATYLGEDGEVTVDGNAIAQIESWTYNEEGSKVPTPYMGATAIVELSGKPRVNGRIRCWYDPTDSTGQGALTQGSQVALVLYPLGNSSGNPTLTIAVADIDTVVLETPVEGGVSQEFSFSATASNVFSED